MKTVLVRYKTRDDTAPENERLIHAVFDELRSGAPAGLRYSVFKLSDGTSFVHFATIDTPDGSNPLAKLDAFARFQEAHDERCVEGPDVLQLFAVEAYDGLQTSNRAPVS